MAKDLLFEIGTEEMPAGSMDQIRNDYLELAAKELAKYRLDFVCCDVFSTPRRLVLYVKGLAEKQADNKETVRGPAVSIAFDDQGNPSRAGEGFARGQGMTIEDLIKKDGYLYAEKVEAGRPTDQILLDILPELIDKLPLPKAMRWGDKDIEFIRPIKWLLALFGSEVINFSVAGIKSSNQSEGHRFLSDGAVTIASPKNYFAKLAKASIIVDQTERKELILSQIDDIQLLDYKPLIDNQLLTEVIDLVEYPTAFMGEFSPDYLELPDEVLITAMQKHQRYFPILDKNDEIAPYFIAVRDGDTENIDGVIEGNEMVLQGRLADARFFFEEDQKYGFENRSEDIKEIVFQKELGSIFDKVERLVKLGGLLSEKLALTPELRKQIERAAALSKNDLATEMVNEFANLQGVMGKEYALLLGEKKQVAAAIDEQYLPRFAGDNLPKTKVGMVLSLAEKIDNLVSHFALGYIPSGSQDPFALRRQATGIVRILISNDLSITVSEMIRAGLTVLDTEEIKLKNPVEEIKIFLKQRLENYLDEAGIRYDIINSVININDDDFSDLKNRAEAIMKIRNNNQQLFVDLVRGLVRAKNIAAKLQEDHLLVKEELLIEKEEKKLYATYFAKKENINEAFAKGNYEKGLKLLVTLKESVDEFLDNVMVMVKDNDVKNNRLALLEAIAKLADSVMDIDQIALDEQ